MNEPRQTARSAGRRRQRSERARAILTRHFGFARCQVESYFTLAAKREGRKIGEIERAVISLGCNLF